MENLGIDGAGGNVLIPGVVCRKDLFPMKARTWSKIGYRRGRWRVVWRTATDVADANSHAIAGGAVESNSDQYITNLTETVVQSHDY